MQRRDLVNTAILTSRQVSEPLRVFMVTQAGKVADVTLQATCSSADESVLKVLHTHACKTRVLSKTLLLLERTFFLFDVRGASKLLTVVDFSFLKRCRRHARPSTWTVQRFEARLMPLWWPVMVMWKARAR
jgi:hypothetical protein